MYIVEEMQPDLCLGQMEGKVEEEEMEEVEVYN